MNQEPIPVQVLDVGFASYEHATASSTLEKTLNLGERGVLMNRTRRSRV